MIPYWKLSFLIRGQFLETPGNLTGPKSYFEIKFSRKVWCVPTSNEVHFVSLANNFEWKTKQLNGPGNYQEPRETGLWSLLAAFTICNTDMITIMIMIIFIIMMMMMMMI